MKRTVMDSFRSEVSLTAHVLLFAFLVLGASSAGATPGRVVANSDDWTFTITGFGGENDADKYAVNIADWFTGGAPGSFIGYGTAFHLGSPGLFSALAGAGHSYILSDATSFTLPDLQTYDGVFIGAWPLGDNPGNMEALIDYVEAGGNVYIFGGTDFYGSISADSQILNQFVNQFGLVFALDIYTYTGSYGITGTHEVLTGVISLYVANGTPVYDEDLANPKGVVIEQALNGAIGVFDGPTWTPVPCGVAHAEIRPALRVYPNPVREGARFVLTPGHSGVVTLGIYTISGRLVRVLETSVAGVAGEVSVEWDGRANDGSTPAAGVYFARPLGSGARGATITIVR